MPLSLDCVINFTVTSPCWTDCTIPTSQPSGIMNTSYILHGSYIASIKDSWQVKIIFFILFYISKEDIVVIRRFVKLQFARGDTVPGTRSTSTLFHCQYPELGTNCVVRMNVMLIHMILTCQLSLILEI